ncbi:MAG: ExeA family protein [Dissulfurimicrobium sp.]|uniref:ExeA family protein n=1 Tax=Dissulfurimicrobium sp. TaxID=2022436 RepID=UPI0040497D6D
MPLYPDYISYFGFKDAPFRLSPDPSFFFPARAHLAAKEVLKFAIERGEGFMVLIGPAGTGKTLILRLILEGLHPDKLPVVVVSPTVNPPGLLRLILEEMGHPCDGELNDLAVLLKRFQAAVLDLASMGKDLFIVVDEAQNLPIDTLEQLRLLSNIETNRRKLLQILLIGQPELDATLYDPRLGQLAQRIVVREELRPFTMEEMGDYICFRLAKAGRADIRPDTGALSRLYAVSQGIPRLINKIMDRALLIASSHGRLVIEAKDINDACETMPIPRAAQPRSGWGLREKAMIVVSGVFLLVFIAWAFFLFFLGSRP